MKTNATRMFTSLSAGLGVLFQAISAAVGINSVLGGAFVLAAAGLVAVSVASPHAGLAAAPFAPPAGPDAPVAPPMKGGWREGLLIGALLYLLYQALFFAQSSVAAELLRALPMADSPGAAALLFQQISIVSPVLGGLFAATLGATLLHRFSARFLMAGIAALTFLGLAVLAQAVLILIGSTAHLEILAEHGPTTLLQGMLLAWLVVCVPLFLGIVLVIGVEGLWTLVERRPPPADQ